MSPELVALLFVLAMLSGVFIVYMGLRQRGMQLEMEHRERMAMIEKGSIPIEPAAVRRRVGSGYARSSRSLSGGIIVVGLGLALMTIISIAGESPEVGVGVGGASAVLGGAFIVHSIVTRPAAQVEEQRTEGPF